MSKIGLVAAAHAGTGANGKREQEGNADQASESSSYTSRTVHRVRCAVTIHIDMHMYVYITATDDVHIYTH